MNELDWYPSIPEDVLKIILVGENILYSERS